MVESLDTLEVPCKYRHLRMIRHAVVELARRSGMGEAQAAQLEMAIDEACTNVIEHSYGGERRARRASDSGIRLTMMRCRDRLVIEIYDHGEGFEPQNVRPPTAEEYLQQSRGRGLGLYIIQKFVDDMDYRRNGPAGNCLRLTKYL